MLLSIYYHFVQSTDPLFLLLPSHIRLSHSSLYYNFFFFPDLPLDFYPLSLLLPLTLTLAGTDPSLCFCSYSLYIPMHPLLLYLTLNLLLSFPTLPCTILSSLLNTALSTLPCPTLPPTLSCPCLSLPYIIIPYYTLLCLLLSCITKHYSTTNIAYFHTSLCLVLQLLTSPHLS